MENSMAFAELIVANITLGILSSFSPCLFPLLPSYIATQLKLKQSKFVSFLSSLALITGIIIVFLAIGLLSNSISGALLKNYATFATIQSLLLIFAGILLIKTPQFMYNIRLPEKLEAFLYNENAQRNSIFFSFILGLVYTIIAAPCAGALFLTVWNMLLGQSFVNQFILVFFFAVGAGFPFLFISLFVDELQPKTIGKIHSASSNISLFLGIIFVILGLYLLKDVII